MHIILVIILVFTTIITFSSLIIKGGGLRENREIFENNYQLYNYILVTTVFSTFIISLSKYSPNIYKIIAQFTWLLCGILLLFTGNRQFVFFSIIYLILYKLGVSENPRKLFLKVVLLIISGITAAVYFSILRLDYIQASDFGTYAKYLSILTGAKCENEIFCDTWIEMLYQLLYAYLGMNYSGLTYSIDFFNMTGGFPIASTTFPVIYRRLELFGMSTNINLYVEKYDYFIGVLTGGDYTHFFSSMFGSIGVESGIIGILLYSCILIYFMRRYVKITKKHGNEIEYMILIFLCTSMIFGLLQFPFTEPFVFFAFINLGLNSLLEIFGKQRYAGQK